MKKQGRINQSMITCAFIVSMKETSSARRITEQLESVCQPAANKTLSWVKRRGMLLANVPCVPIPARPVTKYTMLSHNAQRRPTQIFRNVKAISLSPKQRSRVEVYHISPGRMKKTRSPTLRNIRSNLWAYALRI